MSVGPDRVSVQANFMQLETHDLPGCKRNNSFTVRTKLSSVTTLIYLMLHKQSRFDCDQTL